jgi:LmbE family N-acetylglucosaminyl deacetylase
VLVVAPHPDDEIGCGGALLLHQEAGDEIHVLHVTDGRGSRAWGLGPDEMAERRRLEAASVTRLLGLHGSQWLGLREWEWDDAVLVDALRERLRVFQPNIVYAPSCVDFHPEHIRVADCLARAFSTSGADGVTVRVYEIQVPLTPVLVNLVAPIAPVAAALFRAMRGYETQFASIERCQRIKRYAAAYYRLPQFAEEFWQLDQSAYVRVHTAAIAANGPFRGVRWWPFSDPLCYLRGLDTRRRLRRLAGVEHLEEEAA